MMKYWSVLAMLLCASCRLLSVQPGIALAQLPGKIVVSAVTATGYQIIRLQPDGRGLVQLTDAPHLVWSPTWAPDGTTIWLSDDGAIVQMQADGTGVQTIIPRGVHEVYAYPVLAPDGKYLTFTGYDPISGTYNIYRATPDGASRVRVTGGALVQDCARNAVWAPHKPRVAFMAICDGDWDIYTMNIDGTDIQQLTNHPGIDGAVAWSPDGTELAFSSDRTGHPEIYAIAADGTNLRQLTHNAASNTSPAWSSDGNYIVFVSERVGDDGLYVMRRDGSDQQRIPGLRGGRVPNWSR